MNLDEHLLEAWQAAVPQASTIEAIVARVRAHRRRQRWQRALEIGLTLFALLVFGQALGRDDVAPMVWLLLPFYAVYLPAVWLVILRAPHADAADPAQRVSMHARLRIAQIRVRLRDLWLWRRAALALMAYALIVVPIAMASGAASWRAAAITLFACAVALVSATFLISRRLQREACREYRRMRRLVEAGPDDLRR